MKNQEIIYDDEELEILDYMENGNPQSVPDKEIIIKNLTQSVRAKLNKKKPVSLRIAETDLEKLKIEASQNGIPYQTLINSILHRYLNGTLAK